MSGTSGNAIDTVNCVTARHVGTVMVSWQDAMTVSSGLHVDPAVLATAGATIVMYTEFMDMAS